MPVVAAAQASHHAHLRPFLKLHAALATPGGHGQVSGVGPAVARFLVGQQVGKGLLGVQVGQHLVGVTLANDELPAQAAQDLNAGQSGQDRRKHQPKHVKTLKVKHFLDAVPGDDLRFDQNDTEHGSGQQVFEIMPAGYSGRFFINAHCIQRAHFMIGIGICYFRHVLLFKL